MHKMSENNLSRIELEEMIIKKAMEDENFKKLLLSNPHEAIAQSGFEIPKDMEIKILEETANTSYLIFPYIPEELSDDALDLVAGGSACNCNRPCMFYSAESYHTPCGVNTDVPY